MNYKEFVEELKIDGQVLSIIRDNVKELPTSKGAGCTLSKLKDALMGNVVYLVKGNLSCCGAERGMGFDDDIPNIPGGFGYFLSHGKGEGYPEGERVKCSPELGEKMMKMQPINVMEGYNAICIKPFKEGDNPDLVTINVDMDQLSALIHLFNYRKPDYDNIIVPMVSGCASVFRIPFAELKKENPRAVVGNIDIFSRPHFDENKVFFTMAGEDFKNILRDAEEGIFKSHIWNGVRKRIHNID